MKRNSTKFIENSSFFLIGKQSKFRVWQNGVTQGLPYNFRSIMHMRHDHYSRNKLPTIIPMNESIPKEMLGSTDPNQQDYLDINLTYCGEINVFSTHESNLFNVIMLAEYIRKQFD